MTPAQLATAWVPVPLRWRHVHAGDVFVGGDQRLWIVHAVGAPPGRGRLLVAADCGADEYSGEVDPDDRVNVLIPATEAEAVELSIEQLGARLLERRTLEAG